MIKELTKVLGVIVVISVLFACEGKHVNELVVKSGTKYYYNELGKKVRNSYQKYNDKEYYFNDKGEAIVNSWTADGEKYANSNGELVKYQLYDIDGKRYYFDETGKRSHLTKWKYINDVDDYFYLDDGVVSNDGWKEIDGRWYYFDIDGRYLKSQWIDTSYYVNDKGEMCQEVMLNIDGKDYYFDKNGKCIENYLQISNFINKLIFNLTKGGNHTYVLSNLEIISSSDDDVRFMYIVGDNRFTNGIKSYYEDYVKGLIINNEFVRSVQPVYDSMDNNVLEKMQDWKRMSALYADKCNKQTSMEEYMNGKRNGCGNGLCLVSEDATPLCKNISKTEYPEMYEIITSQYPQGRTVITESGCDEMISIKNTLRRWGIG